MPPPKDTLKFGVVESGILIACLAVGVYVALSPAVVYAPVPKMVLYMMIALLPAILFARTAAVKYEMRLPGFAITAGGAVAVVLALLFTLTHLSKPEQQIAVYRVIDESGQPFSLEPVGALTIHADAHTALAPKAFIDGSAVILIFPEQLGSAEISVIDPFDPMTVYNGAVQYAGNRQSVLQLGRDLKVGVP